MAGFSEQVILRLLSAEKCLFNNSSPQRWDVLGGRAWNLAPTDIAIALALALMSVSVSAGDLFQSLHDTEPGLPALVITAVSACAHAGADLVHLQCTCRLLKELVVQNDNAWRAKARTRFGSGCIGATTASPGISAWRVGMNFLAGHCTYQQLGDPPHNSDSERCGNNLQASCERFVVSGSDDHMNADGLRDPLLVRNANDLSFVRRLPDCHCLRVAIFGPEDRPLVALSVNKSGGQYGELLRVCPVEASLVMPEDAEFATMPFQDIDLSQEDGMGPITEILGSSSHQPSRGLIVGSTTGMRAQVISMGPTETPVGSYAQLNGLFYFPFSTVHEHGVEWKGNEPLGTLLSSAVVSMCWAQPLGAYLFANEHGELCLWGRTSEEDGLKWTICATEIIIHGALWDLGHIVVTDKYIVVTSCTDRGATIYTHTGTRLRTISENLVVADYLGSFAESFGSALQIAALGSILVTSSMKGCCLCLWDLDTGVMLHRFEQAIGHRLTSDIGGPLPDGNDATSLLLLRGGATVLFGAFGGTQVVWHFD